MADSLSALVFCETATYLYDPPLPFGLRLSAQLVPVCCLRKASFLSLARRDFAPWSDALTRLKLSYVLYGTKMPPRLAGSVSLADSPSTERGCYVAFLPHRYWLSILALLFEAMFFLFSSDDGWLRPAEDGTASS
jgi:hypothetical protein